MIRSDNRITCSLIYDHQMALDEEGRTLYVSGGRLFRSSSFGGGGDSPFASRESVARIFSRRLPTRQHTSSQGAEGNCNARRKK